MTVHSLNEARAFQLRVLVERLVSEGCLEDEIEAAVTETLADWPANARSPSDQSR